MSPECSKAGSVRLQAGGVAPSCPAMAEVPSRRNRGEQSHPARRIPYTSRNFSGYMRCQLKELRR